MELAKRGNPEAENQDTAVTPSRSLSEGLISALLILLALLLGAYFRFTGLNWDQGTHLHPDERFLTSVATQIQPVSDLFTYLRTSESSLNPYNVGQGFYVYGNFPMTVTRIVAEWVHSACTTFADNLACGYNYTAYDGVHLLGRALSGLVDLISVLFLFLIGRRLYDWRVGVLAAFFQAIAVMPIQQSHFFTMDTWAASLTTIAIYTAVRAARLGDKQNRWQVRWWLLFGLALGLAAASRINIAPLAGVAPLAAMLWLIRQGHTRIRDWFQFNHLDAQSAFIGVALAAAISILTFRLAQPYAFADAQIAREEAIAATGQEPGVVSLAVRSLIGFNPQWRNNMAEIQRQQAPEASFPPALQWVDRDPLLFPWTNMVLWGMGLSAGIAAWAGLLWALWRIVNGRPDWMAHAIPVSWSLVYFLFMGARWVKSIRYFLPIYPTLFLLGAWALFAIWRRVSRGGEPLALPKKLGVASLFALAILPSLLWANTFVQTTYVQPFTRIAASRWIYENVPTGATLLYQVDGRPQELQLPLKGYDFLDGGFPLTLSFALPEDGAVTAVRLNYLTALDEQNNTAVLRLRLNEGETAETSLTLTSQKQAVELDLPDTAVAAGSRHTLTVELAPGSGSVRADTSRLLNEHWDDLLPANVDGFNAYGSYYAATTGNQVPITFPDSAEKREDIAQWLDESDYIMISSQRAVWSLPRLPLTYPMTTRYYESLFNGALGFKLAAQFHANYQIGPLYISDTAAQLSWGKPPVVGWPPPGDLAVEEAFSVYDHPPVWIFAKTENYSRENTIRVLGAVDLSQVIVMNPLEATQAPNGLMLSPEAQALNQAGGTFRQIFDVDGILNQNPGLAAAVWWLMVILIGWLTFPFAFAIFSGLSDRGYALARILGILLISYFGWITASLGWLPNNRGTLTLSVLLLGVMSLIVVLRRRHELAAFLRQNLALIGVVELVSLLLFLIAIAIRLGNPDVWDVIWGGEKPMDLSYFTATLKSTTFPPYDPWFAGGYINYYYYGFVFTGVLAQLLGVMPTLAYNLILPMLFSFTGMGAFAVAYNLAAARKQRLETGDWRVGAGNLQSPVSSLQFLNKKAIAAGLIAAALAVLLGNLAEVGVLVNAWYQAGSASIQTGIAGLDALAKTVDGAIKLFGGQPAPIYPGDWFWSATRVLNYNPGEVQPITEFPFFTFLYGDLHAHMISMPLQLLALGWAVSFALGSDKRRPSSFILHLSSFIIGGIAIGVLRATNTWDWPTYLVIGSLAVAFGVYRRRGRLSWQWLGQSGALVSLLVGLATLAFWPYAENYGVGYASFKLWPGSTTYLGSYLLVYGLFLLFILTHLAREFRDWTRGWTAVTLRQWESISGPLILALLLYVLLLLALMLRGYWIAPLVLTLVILAGLLGSRPGLPPERRIILILIAASLFLTLFVEIFVLEGDVGRMNTVFKFYLQVWLISSVVGGVTAVWAWSSIQKRGSIRKIWQGVLALMLAAALLYPILAAKAKWDIRMSKEAPNTLDGMAFMNYVQYGDQDFSGDSAQVPLKYDYDAIQWMYRNIDGSPVIIEGNDGTAYRSVGSRVSMYTGLPSVVGWDWHQRQQRAVVPDSLVSRRVQDVNQFYNTTNIGEAQTILEKYGVAYVYAGQLEWVQYNPQGMLKFDQMAAQGYLEEVYRNQGTSIYRVR